MKSVSQVHDTIETIAIKAAEETIKKNKEILNQLKIDNWNRETFPYIKSFVGKHYITYDNEDKLSIEFVKSISEHPRLKTSCWYCEWSLKYNKKKGELTIEMRDDSTFYVHNFENATVVDKYQVERHIRRIYQDIGVPWVR